ncbi:hypothetical protein MMC13_003721 [Lambiella insularis]|nr:hypothetical protein [Lambiella insularis]
MVSGLNRQGMEAQDASPPSSHKNDLGCNTVTTISVTVSVTATITEIVEHAGASGNWSPSADWLTPSLSWLGGTPVPTKAPDLITTTLEAEQTSTIYQIFTNNIGVVPVSSPTSVSSASGLYYFFVGADGIITWLGGQTPPATEPQVLETATLIIEPEPVSSWVSSTQIAQTTSTKTIQLTSTFTEVLTETLTVSTPTQSILASAGAFNGFGPYGWNATTFKRVQTVGSGTAVAGPYHYVTGASSDVAPHWTNPSSRIASAPSVWYHPHNKRQVGAVVTATIDGVVVSWTNSYDGTPETATPYSASPTSSLPGMTSPNLPTALSTAGAVPLEPPSLSLPDITPSANSWTSLIPDETSTTSSDTAWQVRTIWATPATPTSAESSNIFSATALSLPATTFITETVSIVAMSHSLTVYSSPPLSTLSVAPSASAPFPNGTSTAPPVASSPACDVPFDDMGNFTIGFEDLPTFAGFPGDTDYPPIMNPYHSMYWSQGFAYTPPPTDPFAPISGSKLAVFVTNSSANVHPENTTKTPGPGDDVDGEFGAGPNFANEIFWFNAYSAYIGCADAGPLECMMTINGYGYDPAFKDVTLVARQTAYQAPCLGLDNCSLMLVTFGEDFRNLTGLQIIATVGSSPLLYTWYMDSLEIGWADASCQAGQIRAASRS